VALVDEDDAKAGIAEKLGVAFERPADARTGADLVVHASGSGGGLETALGLAGFEATVLELSWFGARRVELGLGGAFHSRRLKLVASQVGHVAASQRGRWDHARRNRLALELLQDRALEVLIAKESRFEELPEVMARLARSPAGTLCHRIDYA
jgi:threonine dehydrogenase-like Zn-dependent dehydrogenase